MSGHAGFQPITQGIPQAIPQPSIDEVNQQGKSQPDAILVSSGGGANPQPQDVGVKSLVGKLDAMLLKAAELSTKAVNVKTLAKTVAGTGVSIMAIENLSDKASRAAASLAALSQFSGRQIAAALVTNGNGCFDWKGGDPVAAAIRKALDDQAELSEALHKLANGKRFTGAAFEAICDQAMIADRRQSEIFTLAMQLADAAGKAGNDSAINVRLDAKLAELLPRQALSMHGNESAIEKMKEKLQPLADRIEAFKAKPNASITDEELDCYTLEVVEAENAIEHGITDGFPTGDGGRWEPDKELLGAAKKLVATAKQILLDTKTEVGTRSLLTFAEKTFGLSNALVPVYRENLAGLCSSFPKLAMAAAIRYKLHDLAKSYMKDPDEQTLAEMRSLARKLRSLNEAEVKKEVALLRKTSEDEYEDMTPADWKEFKAEFSHIQGMESQIEHFAQMVRNIQDKMKASEFLSTSSAKALLEGRFSFSTLVETRIHGISDSDVDPSLDDSRMVSSKTLGSGGANTVSLVKYENGQEFVFKPEAAGRQGIESLLLSKDYKPHQQVAELNIATQKTADVLGLGDIMTKTCVGSHKGLYGIFMEKAPGAEAGQFASGKAKPEPGTLTAAQIQNLPDDAYAKVIGDMIRKTNRIEWLDMITGQGDRHSKNYMIEVGEDLTVTVKCIDNDECFPAYRTGLRTFVLEEGHAHKFVRTVDDIIQQYPPQYRAEIRQRLESDPGYRRLPGNKVIVDATKFENQELIWALKKSVGLHGAALPDFIDEDLYANLMALKEGEARDAWIADIRARLPKEAADSAVNRLDEAIAHAESLNRAGKVVKTEDFQLRDVQKSLCGKFMKAPPNPIKSTKDGKFTLINNDILAMIKHQTHSIFMRDLFSATRKQGWYK